MCLTGLKSFSVVDKLVTAKNAVKSVPSKSVDTTDLEHAENIDDYPLSIEYLERLK